MNAKRLFFIFYTSNFFWLVAALMIRLIRVETMETITEAIIMVEILVATMTPKMKQIIISVIQEMIPILVLKKSLEVVIKTK